MKDLGYKELVREILYELRIDERYLQAMSEGQSPNRSLALNFKSEDE